MTTFKLPFDLPPLPELTASILAAADEEAKAAAGRVLQHARHRVEQQEKLRFVLPPLLDLVGDKLYMPSYAVDYPRVTINLGREPATKKLLKEFQARLIDLRNILGNLEVRDKDIEDAKKRLVRVTLGSDEFDFVKVCYVKKLEKDAKCRIVVNRQRAYTTRNLVCDL